MKTFRNRFKRDPRQSAPGSSAKSPNGTGPPLGVAVPSRLRVKANDEGAELSGYLHRLSDKTGKWKKFWFVAKDKVLYVYKAPEDVVAAASYPVLGFDLDFDVEVRSRHFKT